MGVPGKILNWLALACGKPVKRKPSDVLAARKLGAVEAQENLATLRKSDEN
jgi:hypothetical protein